ncbi:MAG: hypothetical protein KDA85_13020, partial [Planctomycetaceae bacterium]|nr:hypothetical protein [Planctomycetaceae bacterium]
AEDLIDCPAPNPDEDPSVGPTEEDCYAERSAPIGLTSTAETTEGIEGSKGHARRRIREVPHETHQPDAMESVEDSSSVTDEIAIAPADFAVYYQNLLELRRLHAEYVIAEQTRPARRLKERIASLEKQFRYPIPAPEHQEPVVHAVGVYSSHRGDNPIHVRVTDDSGPVVLVLSAYSAVKWDVEVSEGVQIDVVICTGYDHQQVVSIPEGIPVLYFDYEQSSGEYAYAYGADRSKWGELDQFVATQTGGLPITTGLGWYYAPESCEIGPGNVRWRLQMLNSSAAGK